MLFIFFMPQVPAIEAHDSVIKIYACLSWQMVFETYVDVDNGVDQTNRVHKNIFCPAIPDTGNACKYRNIFQPAGIPQANQKLFIYLM